MRPLRKPHRTRGSAIHGVLQCLERINASPYENLTEPVAAPFMAPGPLAFTMLLILLRHLLKVLSQIINTHLHLQRHLVFFSIERIHRARF